VGTSTSEGLTQQLIEHLNGLDFITRIDVIGSCVEQTSDAYSDVDLLLTIKDVTPDIALFEVTESVKAKFQPVWYDFANSLMPDKFLVSTFIGGDNPFAFYDVSILNSDKNLVYDKTQFENDQWIHLMKLWVMNFKYMMRDAPQFEKRFATMMEKANISHYSDYRTGFYQLLLKLKDKKTIKSGYLNMLDEVFRNS
jgi:predicted nucleotidyltransferase